VMFNRNQIRRSDPFRLSTLGWLRAAASWLRGPAFMSRWLLFGLTTLSVLSVAGTAALLVTVMQPASLALRSVIGAPPAAAPTTSPPPVSAMLRSGPSSSELVELPGYECHPLPGVGLRWLNPFRDGPAVVAIDRDGVIWGPSCVVTGGLAGL
jgi:hypothetical protein